MGGWQSDLHPHCLQYRLHKNISRQEEKMTKAVTDGKRVNDYKCKIDVYSLFVMEENWTFAREIVPPNDLHTG